MDPRAEVDAIRVISVTRDGSLNAFSSLGTKLSRLQPNGFIAIDTEFSGLGRDIALRDDNLQTRYAAIRKLADKRAILSVGISVFDPVPDPHGVPDGVPQYNVSTFDLLMACQSEFSMCPKSGAFLTAHSFDFNRMFEAGIPYVRASTEAPPPTSTLSPFSSVAEATQAHPQPPWIHAKLPRGLLWRIGRHGVPIIVHNGLFDLVFLYAAFQAPLPPTLNAFVSALLDCLPAGVYDTKVLADSTKNRASFLAYLFSKAVLQSAVSVRTAPGLPSPIAADPPNITFAKSNELCPLFAFRGFCPRGLQCPFAHDAFKVAEEEKAGKCAADSKEAYARLKTMAKNWKRQLSESKVETEKMSKKQRRKKQREAAEQAAAATTGASLDANGASDDSKMVVESPNGVEEVSSEATAMEIENTHTVDKGTHKEHTAGWDAFCTAYIFAVFKQTMSTDEVNKEHNFIALAGKLSNLNLKRSAYAFLDDLSTQAVPAPDDTNAATKPNATANETANPTATATAITTTTTTVTICSPQTQVETAAVHNSTVAAPDKGS